jgi:transposase
MPKAFPLEFRRDVVAIARRRESSLKQIAHDFGISESCVQRWLTLADVEEGVKPGVTTAEAAETRDLKKRVRVLEQENEILRRAAAFFARDALPK